jgi:predicted nucleic acid binding AN1-type Zn finger protein
LETGNNGRSFRIGSTAAEIRRPQSGTMPFSGSHYLKEFSTCGILKNRQIQKWKSHV